ncbi:MAG: tetratricopeptide repeat protein [Bacteroidota bacterium]
MNSKRLKLLEEYLQKDPDDPFNLYAIATEYRNSNPDKALELYYELLRKHTQYLPTYYQAATLLGDMEKNDEAEKIFKQGIELAQQQSNALTLRELQSAYNELLFED